MVRKAVAESGHTSFDLGGYDSCVMAYCGTRPEFHALGLRAGKHPIYGPFLALKTEEGYVKNREAVRGDYDRRCGWTYAGAYDGRTGFNIPTTKILAKIDEQLAAA
jgi:hypothetical protein